ncbi:MAG: hypothetical protein ABFE07_23015 [Armatimonadia bacterium]
MSRLFYQTRPSDHLAAEKPWRYPLQPMQPEPRPFLAWLFGRK